ncbi:MAG: hypothetical protein M0R73_02250 [Dehalococcoidia bacterium]|nr:hypothetical protein [Dehalococcoidia bacterium]
MNNDSSDRLDTLVTRLREAGDRLTLTATLDLTPDSTGQPPALRVFRQATREAIEGLDKRVAWAVEAEVEDLQAIAEDATKRGVLGLVYVAHPDNDPDTPRAESGDFIVVDLDTPVRTSLHAGYRARIFEVARTAFLDRPVALVTTDVHTMSVTRIKYGAAAATAEVDWPAHYLIKRGQDTKRDNFGGGLRADERGGGHAYLKQQRRVEHQRDLFANEAAEHLARFLEPDDLLVIEGVDEARQQVLSRLSQELQDEAVQLGAPDPQEDERDRFARLRRLAEESRLQRAGRRVEEWFSGASPNTLGGVEVIQRAAEEGRVASLIVHQDATQHMGYADDSRLRESPVDADAVEAALGAAIDQGAAIWFTDDARVLDNQGGVIGTARY